MEYDERVEIALMVCRKNYRTIRNVFTPDDLNAYARKKKERINKAQRKIAPRFNVFRSLSIANFYVPVQEIKMEERQKHSIKIYAIPNTIQMTCRSPHYL